MDLKKHFTNLKEFIEFLNNSISKRLLTLVFSFYILVTITVTLLHMFLEYQDASDRIKQELVRFESIVKGDLIEAIWNYDVDQVNKIIEGVINSEVIIGADTYTSLGESLNWKVGIVKEKNEEIVKFYGGKIIEENLKIKIIKHEFELFYKNAQGNEFKIGEASFYSSGDRVLASVKSSFFIIIINALIKTTALLIFFLWIGYYYLTLPLFAITKATKNISNGIWLGNKIILENRNLEGTEIETLANSFNLMIDNLTQTTKALLQTQHRLSGVIDSMPSALICVDAFGFVTEWNQKSSQLLGKNHDEIIGKNINQELSIHSRWWNLTDQAILDKTIKKLSKETKKINNEIKYFDILVYPVLTSDYLGSVIRIDDITNKIKLEEIMTQTEKMASVGGLAAGVAHEINNPLGAILQGAQNVIRRVEPSVPANQKVAEELGISMETIKEYMEKRQIFHFLNGIRQSGERASHIVSNLLQFSRRTNNTKTSCNIIEIIERSIELASADYDLRKQTDFKRIKVKRNYQENLPHAYICMTEIEQVLINLLKNAAQAMRQQSGEQIIEVSVSTTETSYLQLEISDNGPGMPDEVKKRIFEPFFTTKPMGEGTGLGLSVSYGIVVDNHKGSFLVDSQVGLGTKFTITLPNSQTIAELSANEALKQSLDFKQ
ncbi:MAG: ATP-binding protein [Gammaproteobacteria bacterium]